MMLGIAPRPLADAPVVALQPPPLVAPTPARSAQRTRLDLDAIRASALESEYKVAALARSIGVSMRQLQRLFLRQVGCSPGAWLREERLQAARRLLLGPMSVKHVALTLAFRQESQFSRDFRNRFGCSPSAARARQERPFLLEQQG